METRDIRNRIKAFILNAKDQFLPQISIDCVIFGYEHGNLQVLLVKFPGVESRKLPSGFIKSDEDLDDAALRNLQESTGISQIFLRQFHSFGKSSRFFPAFLEDLFKEYGVDKENAGWLFKRFVTIGYYALVDFHSVDPKPGLLEEKVEWFNVYDLPDLIMDHNQIIEDALSKLRIDLQNQPIGLNLLPDQFTMPELQTLYETILNRSVDRGNFRRKMLNSKTLLKLNQVRTGSKHRAPHLYQFDTGQLMQQKEEEILKMGF